MMQDSGIHRVAAIALCVMAIVANTATGIAATNSTQVINGVGASGGAGSAGSAGLTLSTPATLAFSTVTLTGANQNSAATAAIDVIDASGNGSGWNVQLTSTSFSTGGGSPLYLPGPVTGAAPSWACTAGSTCTTPTNSGITYAMTVPQPAVAGGAAPTPAKLGNAAAGTGMGDQNTNQGLTMAVPANVRAGNYSSTWTFSYASGP